MIKVGDIVMYDGKRRVVKEHYNGRLILHGVVEQVSTDEIALLHDSGKPIRFYGTNYKVIGYRAGKLRIKNKFGMRWVNLEHYALIRYLPRRQGSLERIPG